MAQKYKVETYADGSVVLSNIRNDLGIPVLGVNDNLTATKVNQWYDGTAMTDVKVDGKIYLKFNAAGDLNGSYFKVNLPNDKELFLEKDTMAQMRALNSTEILLLKMGYYKGIRLNGYYVKGDTPAPIDYFISSTSDTDNDGTVLSIGGVKFEYYFSGYIDISYFGLNNGLDVSSKMSSLLNEGFKLDGNSKNVVIGSPMSIDSAFYLKNIYLSYKNTDLWADQTYAITCSNFNGSELINVIFDGSAKSGGLKISNSNNSNINDCRFINNGYIGLYAEYCENIYVNNPYSENNGYNYVSIGNSGIRFEFCNRCQLNGYIAKNEFGKVATLSNCTFCSITKLVVTESNTEQSIVYLSRGSYNTCYDLTIKGSKHALKLSRQESNSTVSNFLFDSSDFSMQGYSTLLIQGGSNNIVSNGKIISGTQDVIRVESHPSSSTDPVALSSALNNYLHDIDINVPVATRTALFVTSNFNEGVYADNNIFKNINVIGNGNLQTFFNGNASSEGVDIRTVNVVNCNSSGTTTNVFSILRGTNAIIDGGVYNHNGSHTIISPANHYGSITVKNAIFNVVSTGTGVVFVNYSGTGKAVLLDNVVNFNSSNNIITMSSGESIDVLRNIFKKITGSNRNIVISDTVTTGRLDGNVVDGNITANNIATGGVNYISTQNNPLIRNWDPTFAIKGVAALATQTEVNTGTVASGEPKIVTPITLGQKVALSNYIGMVKLAAAQSNITQADLVNTTAADVAALVSYINTSVVPLVNAIKASQNTELTNQRTAGQQAP